MHVDTELRAVLCGDFEDPYAPKPPPLVVDGPLSAHVDPSITSAIAWEDNGTIDRIGFYATPASCKTRDKPVVELRDFALLPGRQPVVPFRGITAGRGWIEVLDTGKRVLRARIAAYGGGAFEPPYDLAGEITAPICATR